MIKLHPIIFLFIALVFAACSENAKQDTIFKSLDNGERKDRQALYEDCLEDNLEACEALRYKRSYRAIADPIPDDFLIVLRDNYAAQCRDGNAVSCYRLPRLLREEFDLGTADAKNIDDGDRLKWRACLLDQQESCEAIRDTGKRFNIDYENRLRADAASGGQVGLLARVTDGNVKLDTGE